MPTRSISFTPSSTSSSPPTYSLLSLPPSLIALLTSSNDSTSPSLEIRGHTTDAAVLVTPTQTFSLRGVQNSNSLCLCSSTPRDQRGWFDRDGQRDEGTNKRKRGEEGLIQIETVLHETLEVVPTVARTERLAQLMKGSEYRGEDAEDDKRDSNINYQTLSTLASLLPASDAEIRVALTKQRIITLDLQLRSIPTSYLLKILPALIQVLPHVKRSDLNASVIDAEVEELLEAMEAAGECRAEVGRQVLEWFGKQSDRSGWWSIRMDGLVREVGIVALAQEGYASQPLEPFLKKWKALCHHFEPLCSTSLLANTAIITRTDVPASITYLPSSHLSADPSTRFSELFTLRPKWLAEEMTPFIEDLGDKKKRDAFVMKFVRKVKGADGRMIWSARNLWTAA